MVVEQLKEKSYFENLDCLRFFAFFVVFLSHCVYFFEYTFPSRYLQLIQLHFFANGNLGVNFFFVLSGFLISWLLLKEKEKSHTIHLPYFYMRRVLRIWPVYFMVVLVGFTIGAYCNFTFNHHPFFSYKIEVSQLKWYLVFLANYDLIFNTVKSVLLSVLWSVSVEEQFYLFWPLLLVLLPKKAFPYSCFFIITASFIWRILYAHTYLSYVSTFYVMSDLACGGVVCYYSLYNTRFLDHIKQLKKNTIRLIYLLFFLYIPLHGFSHMFGENVYSIYAPFEPLFFSAFFCFIIIEQNYAQHSFFKFGKIRSFSELGKISYGLYAYHMLAFPITYYLADQLHFNTSTFWHYLAKIAIALIFTLLISYLSYHVIEKKFLKLKEKFRKI